MSAMTVVVPMAAAIIAIVTTRIATMFRDAGPVPVLVPGIMAPLLIVVEMTAIATIAGMIASTAGMTGIVNTAGMTAPSAVLLRLVATKMFESLRE